MVKNDKNRYTWEWVIILCIYSIEKVFIWCGSICIYFYGAFLWLKIVKNYQK